MADDRAPLTFATAAEVCTHLALQDPALQLLNADLSPGGFLRLLVQQFLYVDAIRFMGLAMPGRKAVWWACTCVRHTAGTLSPAERAALGAAVHWVLDPNAEHTQTAKAAMRNAGESTPAGAAALAAAKVAKVPVAAGKAAAGAVFMAAARAQGTTPAQLYRQFVALGLEVNRLPAPWERGPG